MLAVTGGLLADARTEAVRASVRIRSPTGARSRCSADDSTSCELVFEPFGRPSGPLRDHLDLLQGLLLLLQVLLRATDGSRPQGAGWPDEPGNTRRSRSAPRVRPPRSGRRRASLRSSSCPARTRHAPSITLDARAGLRALADLREDLLEVRTCFSVSLVRGGSARCWPRSGRPNSSRLLGIVHPGAHARRAAPAT
jgi:hypothetical protein